MQAVDLKSLEIGDFVEFVDIAPRVVPQTPSGDPSAWFVMLTEPQQDLTTVWRLHELGLELFVPTIRKRVKTGRIGKNGHKITRVIAKPMFPGYGFLRMTDTNSPGSLVWQERDGCGIRGVRSFLQNESGHYVTLPDAAVRAVFRRQFEEQQKWLQESGGRRGSHWKRGDQVRIDEEGGPYAGLVATIDKVDSKGRIEILLGMIRYTVPAEMVVAA